MSGERGEADSNQSLPHRVARIGREPDRTQTAEGALHVKGAGHQRQRQSGQ